jgi:hypothetical protein
MKAQITRTCILIKNTQRHMGEPSGWGCQCLCHWTGRRPNRWRCRRSWRTTANFSRPGCSKFCNKIIALSRTAWVQSCDPRETHCISNFLQTNILKSSYTIVKYNNSLITVLLYKRGCNQILNPNGIQTENLSQRFIYFSDSRAQVSWIQILNYSDFFYCVQVWHRMNRESSHRKYKERTYRKSNIT